MRIHERIILRMWIAFTCIVFILVIALSLMWLALGSSEREGARGWEAAGYWKQVAEDNQQQVITIVEDEAMNWRRIKSPAKPHHQLSLPMKGM